MTARPRTAYAAVRRNDEDGEYLNLRTIEPTPEMVATNLASARAATPVWHEANPVVRVVRVVVAEVPPGLPDARAGRDVAGITPEELEAVLRLAIGWRDMYGLEIGGDGLNPWLRDARSLLRKLGGPTDGLEDL